MKILLYGIREKLCLLLNKNRPLLWPQPVVVFCLAFVFSFLGALGQPKGEGEPSPAGSLMLTPLSVGDTLPEISLKNVLGTHDNTYTVGNTNGKLLILDFFHTTCGSCISKISRLDSFRNGFRDKLDLVMVTRESFSYLKSWWPQSRYSRNFSLPVVTADTLLHQMFPHEIISHFVWVDPSGVIRAITGQEEIVYGQIAVAIQGNWPVMPLKKDNVDFNPNDPLFIPAYNPEQNLGGKPLFHSGFFEPIAGAGGSWVTSVDSMNGHINTRIINFNLVKLISIANDVMLWLQPSFIQVSPGLLTHNAAIMDRLWTEGYCYEASLALGTGKPAIRKALRDDIEKFLGLRTRVSEKEVDCLELMVADPTKLPPAAMPLKSPGTDSIHFTRINSYKNLAAYLNKMPGELPVVYNQETLSELKIWVANKDLENRTDAAKMLNGLGLALKPTRKKLLMLCIE